MKIFFILLTALLPFNSFGQCTLPAVQAGWPGNYSGTDICQTGQMEFLQNIISFKDNANVSYLSFEAYVAGTTTQYFDGSHNMFLIRGDDKAVVATILTAFNAGNRFIVQYKRQTFMNRPVLEIMSFFIQK